MASPRKNAPKPNTQELALVPVEEQPYPLPEDWKWVRGHALFKPQVSLRPSGTTFKYIDIDAVNNKNQTIQSAKILPTSEAPSRANRGVHEGDTLFSMVRPYLRNIAYVDASLSDAIASTGFYICSPLDGCNSRYIFHMMTSCYVVDGLNKFMKGDNSPSVRKGDIENFPFPLPPLDEQERIVTRIESLFAKLDEAKEKVESVLDSYETRKAAILHKAFTGELTAKWREERGIERDSWKRQTLNAVCSSIFDGDHMPPPKAETGIPFLVISNVNTGSISFENTRFVPQTYFDSLSSTRKPKQNDVLYTLVGSYGIPVLVDTNKNFCFQRHMALLKPHSIDSKFLWYFLQTKEAFLYASQVATGTAQLTVPIKKLREMPILHPSLNEQQEISRILDSLLEKEQQSKEAAETVLEQIDLMKKAILAKAFRGELGEKHLFIQ